MQWTELIISKYLALARTHGVYCFASRFKTLSAMSEICSPAEVYLPIDMGLAYSSKTLKLGSINLNLNMALITPHCRVPRALPHPSREEGGVSGSEGI